MSLSTIARKLPLYAVVLVILGMVLPGWMGTAGVPSAPMNLKLISRTASTLSISWDAPRTNPESVHRYVVFYRLDGKTTWTRVNVSPTASPYVIKNLLSKHYAIKNLLSNSEYNVKVRAENTAAVGSETQVQSFRTISDSLDRAIHSLLGDEYEGGAGVPERSSPLEAPTPKPEVHRGFFSNSLSAPDANDLPFDILDPVTLSLIGLLVTLFATGIQLFRGK